MFKFRKIYIILGIFILLILGAVTVSHAAERADMSNIEFEWTGYDENSHGSLHLKVKNVTLIEDNHYYVHVSHDKDEELTVTDFESLDTDNVWNKHIWDDDYTIYDLQSIIAGKGDIYIWICELDSDFIPKIVVKAKKIERLEQLPIGKRLTAHFMNDVTHIYSNEPVGDKDRKVKVKIGVVTDKSILQAIKNNEKDSLQKLLNYAKSAKSVYNGTLPLKDTRETVFDSANFVTDEYYYAYMELDDENGTYYPIEDVSLYQCYGLGLYNYLDSEFKWDLSEENTEKEPTKEPTKAPENSEKEKDNTTATNKLPNTGVQSVIIASIVLVISISIIAVKLKKYKGV